MYYPSFQHYKRLITIIFDGKSLAVIDNNTGRRVEQSVSKEELNAYEFAWKAASGMERLLEFEKQQNDDEIKVGDRVQFIDNFEPSYVYPYATDFVDELDIPNALKIKYCYSVSRPPLNTTYSVEAIANNRAYIQTASCAGRCYVVSTRILKKVSA